MLVNAYNNSMLNINYIGGFNMLKQILEWLESDNPTPQQIKNRIIIKRKWRNFKKIFSLQDEVIAFMFGVVVFLTVVMFFFAKLHGVI